MFKYNYNAIKVKEVQGRYVTLKDIAPFMDAVAANFSVSQVGKSVQKRDIESIDLGSGNTRILMWSQMHGNESTTTKAVLDLISFLNAGSDLAVLILEACTIRILPMLNPDGALAYTRVNANEVDLNRDAQERTQPESEVLREAYQNFKPHFCFNLHDQRTIFNVGDTNKPATVSFLAPASDPERSVSKNRAVAMKLIVAMNNELQRFIPGQVGRYDDGFNENCVGDTFQMLNTPTILFEAGHYPDDYEREQTRYYIFLALMKALQVVANDETDAYSLDSYLDIPENNKLFLDVIIHHLETINPSYKAGDSAGILYVETLVENKIEFVPKLEKIGDLSGFFGHKTYNCLSVNDLAAVQATPKLSNLLK